MADKDIMQTDHNSMPKIPDDNSMLRKIGNMYVLIGGSVGAVLGLIAYIHHWF